MTQQLHAVNGDTSAPVTWIHEHPFTRGGRTAHVRFDHTGMERRVDLGALTIEVTRT